MLSADAPVVLLQHHGLDNLHGKTGLTLLRYRRSPLLAVVDPDHAGGSLQAITGIHRSVPIVASMAAVVPLLPTGADATAPVAVAVVGLAPSGGRLSADVRADVAAALAAGLSVASGLHTRLADDPELAALVRPGRWIWDLRREPPNLSVGSARAAALPGRRLLAVGTDMSVGKMSACLEIWAAARRGGTDARFVPTGQAGILIAGGGVALDAVRVDYAAGAVEQAVLTAGEGATADTLLLVEGQGSFCHPGSTATLPLLRGSQPTQLLLVHRAGQGCIRGLPQIPLPPLAELVITLERMAALARPESGGPVRVAAIALNTGHLDAEAAAAALSAAQAETGLPCADPVREGGERLLGLLQTT